MKIVQINTLFAPHRHGGAEIFLERFTSEMIQRGHRVVVACTSPAPSCHGGDELRVHEFAVRNVYWPFDGAQHPRWKKAVWHARNSFGSGGAADVDALLEREKPDLVHTHNLSGFTSAVWQRAAARGIPLVHTIHDYALLCPSATMFRKDSNCPARCLACRVLSFPKIGHSRAVDAVVGCSQFALSRHLENGYFGRASRYVIHSGNPHDGSPLAGNPGAGAQALRVGFLGRLVPSKGIELMLDALADRTDGRWQLLVAGRGDDAYETAIKARYEPRGVRFLGQVNAANFLAQLDVLVVPSLWHEPYGLVIGEAASAGVPVVASAVGGIPEIVDHGHTGLLFDPGDRAALRSHVACLAADRTRLGEMARTCLERADSHTFERTVDRYLQVYSETLN